MKPKTAIHLEGGQVVKLREPVEQVTVMFAQMHRAGPGSAFQFTRVTDHGTLKKVYFPVEQIRQIQEL